MFYKDKGENIKHKDLDGSSLKVGIVRAHYNDEFTSSMFNWAKKALLDARVKEKNIVYLEVPGSYELLYGINKLLKNYDLDVVLPLGCLIKGKTPHFEYISEAVAQGIMKYNVDGEVPVVFGILNCLNLEQVAERCQNNEKNSGWVYGKTAVEMGILRKS